MQACAQFMQYTLSEGDLYAFCILRVGYSKINYNLSGRLLPNIKRNSSSDIVWDTIEKNYDMILGVQLSNSFIILMALSESENPQSASEISKVISSRSNGKILKVPATLQDSIEKRLKREGYMIMSSTSGKSKYSITSKGNRLLRAWIAFLDGCS
jgi:predicted transcriptional regulator